MGKLDFWDLNKDVEVPVYSYEVGKHALNKLHWSQDGKRLAVGDVNGKISILNIDKEVIYYRLNIKLFSNLVASFQNRGLSQV